MQITDELIVHLAELSRLKLKDTAKEKMKTELGIVVDYIEILKQLDTDGFEPLSHIFDITNVMRPDEVKVSFLREDILKNAPDGTEETFVVPKTVE